MTCVLVVLGIDGWTSFFFHFTLLYTLLFSYLFIMVSLFTVVLFRIYAYSFKICF